MTLPQKDRNPSDMLQQLGKILQPPASISAQRIQRIEAGAKLNGGSELDSLSLGTPKADYAIGNILQLPKTPSTP